MASTHRLLRTLGIQEETAANASSCVRVAEALFAVLAAALVLGGGLDDETAQRIGEAQRGVYPSPPGLEQANAIKAKRLSLKAPEAEVFPRYLS